MSWQNDVAGAGAVSPETASLETTSVEMESDVAFRRLRWLSRRGFKEVEVILLPFTELAYRTLAPELQGVYVELLESADADLFDWLTQRTEPEAAHLLAMVGLILRHYEQWLEANKHAPDTGRV